MQVIRVIQVIQVIQIIRVIQVIRVIRVIQVIWVILVIWVIRVVLVIIFNIVKNERTTLGSPGLLCRQKHNNEWLFEKLSPPDIVQQMVILTNAEGHRSVLISGVL